MKAKTSVRLEHVSRDVSFFVYFQQNLLFLILISR